MRKYLKSTVLIALMLVISGFLNAQGVAINTDGESADASSMLDVKATNKGLLVPRISIPNLSAAAPVTSPAVSLLVYNTNAGTGLGYHYWNGSSWVKLLTAADVHAPKWSGNNNTSDAIGRTGNVGIGTASPEQKLEVAGIIEVDNPASGVLAYLKGGSDDSAYEWAGFYSGETRQGIILWDGPWTGAGNRANEFSITAENSNWLTLTSATGTSILGGNVGINTNSPLNKLHVAGATRIVAQGSGWEDHLNLYSNDGTNRWNILVDNGASDLFRLTYNGGAVPDVIAANTSGNVGIGTSSPSQKLHVNGNIKLDDNMMVEGVSSYRVYRNLATYDNSINAAAGAFVITTSQPWNSACMFRVKIEGYFYDATSPFEMIIGGYMYTNNSFYNYGYINNGAKRLSVRFARNISTNTVAIIIGSEGDSYSYPKLTVTTFMQGHSGINEAYADGWTIAQYTSLVNFDYITTVPDVTTLPSGSNNYIQNQTAVNQPASFRISGSGYLAGSVGIGTITPASPLSVGNTSQFQVASNGNIASIRGQPMEWPLSNSQGFLFNNGTGTLSWRANGVCYNLPNTGGSNQWVKLGTLTIAQQGKSAFIRVVSNSGYNASIDQNYEVFIRFKTSNGSSVDVNGFAGDASYYVNGRNGQFFTNGRIKFVANSPGAAATAYDVYMYLGPFTGTASFYEISTSEGTWTHSGTISSDPGVASSSILLATQEFSVGSNSLVVTDNGNVGVSTLTPTEKLVVNGKARSGALNNILYVDGLYYTTIQDAINALPASGGKVIIPAGTWILSSAINISGKSNITIEGVGASTIITSGAGSNFNLVYINQSTGIVIKNLSLICLDRTQYNNRGVNINESAKCIIENCYFTDCNYGVYLYHGDNILNTTEYNIIQNNYFYQCSYGVYLYSGKYCAEGDVETSQIKFNTIANNEINCNNITGTNGIYIEWYAYNNIVNDNIVNKPTNYGIKLTYSYAVTVEGNTISAPTSYGIHAQGAHYSSITGNKIINSTSTTGEGIKLLLGNHQIVSNNVVTSANYNITGIDIGGSYITISGNTVQNFNRGYWISATYSTIMNNVHRMVSAASGTNGFYITGGNCTVVGNRSNRTNSIASTGGYLVGNAP
jgi:parallel beta-helix repeat protein